MDLFVIKDTDLPRPQRTVQVRKMLYGSMIPIDLIVFAYGFVDWNGRHRSYGKDWQVLNNGKSFYGTMSSINVAKLYAGTPTEFLQLEK